MGMSRADYLSQLQALLPQGSAWPRDPDALLTRLLDGFAEEFARVDARAAQLLDESDPRATYELLADWERVAGLPGTCALLAGIDLSVEQRRAALVAKLTERGGQSRAYFIALAARLGFTVTITEYHEWSVLDDVDAPLNGADWNFVWAVNAPLNTLVEWTVNSDVEMPFAVWGNALLECAINQNKPAHTVALFVYS
ncbi:MAG: hypothetical protein A2Z95_06275 [Gallionellales bacterium GWA2_60_18]|nr:MAG: hypothetical protein A2Z95_06275 [Gallionellales bacterium GWA2_60_18]